MSFLMLAGLLTLPGGAAAATSNLAIYVPNLGGACIFIGAPANTNVGLTWKDASGQIKEQGPVATGAGDPMYCSSYEVVAVGDTIRVSYGGKSHKLTIPALFAAIDRVNDVMSGSGPAGKVLRIECQGNPFGQFEPCQYTKKVTVDGSGHWSAHIPFDMYGGFRMYVAWKNAYGDSVYRLAIAPYFSVFVGKSRFSGVTQPLTTGTVSVETAEHVAKGMGTGESGPLDGSFVGKLRNGANHLVKALPSDVVSSDVSPDASFQVPDIQATATAADNRVAGDCDVTGNTTWLYVELYRNGKWIGAGSGGGSDNPGEFDFDFSNSFPAGADIKVGDKVYIECIQDEGDRAIKVVTAQ